MIQQSFDGRNHLLLKVELPSEYVYHRAKKRKECIVSSAYGSHAVINWRADGQIAIISIYQNERWFSSNLTCYPYNLETYKAFVHFCKFLRVPFTDFLNGRNLEEEYIDIDKRNTGDYDGQ